MSDKFRYPSHCAMESASDEFILSATTSASSSVARQKSPRADTPSCCTGNAINLDPAGIPVTTTSSATIDRSYSRQDDVDNASNDPELPPSRGGRSSGRTMFLGEDEQPHKFDIVCGRDKFCHGHVGNRRFRVIIAMNRERYQTSNSREEKSKITNEIVALIRTCKPGGRFLKLDTATNRWCIVTEEYAREKVSHALRSARDPNIKKPRKKRKPAVRKKVVHSESENRVYNDLLSEQLKIFDDLVVIEGRKSNGHSAEPQRQESEGSWGDDLSDGTY